MAALRFFITTALLLIGYSETASARYLESDPIGLAGGLNPYAYVRSNPIRWIDRLGLLPGDSYPSAEAAAHAAIGDINTTSMAEDREYAGLIYQGANGLSYSYSNPAAGGQAGSVPYDIFPIYGDPVSSYHTHGGNDAGYRNNDFSPDDVWWADHLATSGTPIYVGTPSGDIKSYLPGTHYQDNITQKRCETIAHPKKWF